MAVFALASLAAGLAPSAPVLIAARAVQGAGAALLAPAALALVLGVFPPGPGRGRALGVWGAVSGAGGAAGVLLSGVLTELYGWPAVFLVSVPVAAVSLAATLVLVPVDRPAGGEVDILGALTSTAGLTALVYALTAKNPSREPRAWSFSPSSPYGRSAPGRPSYRRGCCVRARSPSPMRP